MPSQESPKSSQSGNTSGFDTTDHENLLHVETSASDFDFSVRGVAAGTTDDEIAMGLGGFTRERPDSDDSAQMLHSAGADDGKISVALLGRGTAAGMQMRLVFWLLLLMIAFGFVVFTILKDARSNSLQVAVAGQALTQSQRLAKAAPRALAGQQEGLDDLAQSADVFDRAIRALSQGGSGVVPVAPEWRGARWKQMEDLSQRTIANANRIVGQKDFLLRSGEAWLQAGQQVQPLHEAVEDVVAAKLERNAPAREIAAAGQLEVLAQRIGRVVSEFQSPEGMSPEASFLLNKDLVLFAEISEGLLNGNAELRLTPAGDEALKSLLHTAIGRFDALKENAGFIAANAQDAATLRNAEIGIDADSGPLRLALEELQGGLANRPAVVDWQMIAGAAILLLALLVVIGFFRVQVKESRRLQAVVENDRRRAEAQEFEAKRVNDASQAAILRLMNELQAVAEGDLTQEATVTEDITGAIADSVNYTVEELRMLVGNVQNTATQVAQTTEQVETSATELLATSNEQLHEIRETGQAVLEMASRINGMSSQAQESAEVARQSLQAAETGLNAVQASIGGMNIIRDQIQETSKRIKRLGESSQEIGEITELISDITEQTNVLALNAAIQAASAGEAGRGFSVVAEEVQRLAERSADATRQIAALVKTIQTDTQDAVSAMERSTRGVVDGARLSDSAGTALAEIDRVSRRLADLIAQISSASAREASLASDVADNIQHIFAVTEQTSESTRTSAQQVRELAVIADELRQSVARFKIA